MGEPGAFSPDIAVSGPGNSIVHVVWTQDIEISPGIWGRDVFYARSQNNGMNWEPERPISQIIPDSYAYGARIDAQGNNVHVIWDQSSFGNPSEIYYSGSQNDGISWSGEFNDLEISHPDGNDAYSPQIASYDGPGGIQVHAVWIEFDDESPGGTDEVHYSMSMDPYEPVSWTGSSRDNIVSCPDTDNSMFPTIAVGMVAGKVKPQILWQEDIDLNDKASKTLKSIISQI